MNDGDVDTGPATASTGSSEDGLSELASEQLDAFFVLKDSLAPAMSLMGPNVAVVSELWAAAKGLSWKLRYMMFAHWK